MATAFPSQEHRSLKKSRLGPPDVYPQEPKQKEDELSTFNVKQGFNSTASFDEHATARGQQFTVSKLASQLAAIINKKIELNTFADTSKKKLQINKDNFWPVTPRNKATLDAWLKDLAGTKPLSQLSKRVPIMNKREEVFITLSDYNVVMVRAAWYIKMAAAYAVTISETKMKKRQTIDPSMDWAQSLTRFMKEQLTKIADHYVGQTQSSQTPSFLTTTAQHTSQVDLDLTLRLWNYCTNLLRYMYLDGLLDRQEVLLWVVEQVERCKSNEDSMLKIVLNQALMYMHDVVESVFVSRRLAQYCCKKLAYFYSEANLAVTPPLPVSAPAGVTAPATNPSSEQPTGAATGTSTSPLLLVLNEYNHCPQHRTIVLNLSTIVLAILIKCPAALVWFGHGDSKSHNIWFGSPLDLLPCLPSQLPMPPGNKNQWIRRAVRRAEHHVRVRSRAVEVRWSTDKWQQSLTGHTSTKVLNVLDYLDRHNFEKVESNNSLDTLYNKMFSSCHGKDPSEVLHADEPIVMLLSEWAVSAQRVGHHRAIVVAKLLEKRQADCTSEKFTEAEAADEKEGHPAVDAPASNGHPFYQNLLHQFLDKKAPVLEDSVHTYNKPSFSNLVHLFSELIRHDVFSHDAYISTLISRGDLHSPAAGQGPEPMGMDLLSVKSALGSNKPDTHDDEMKMDLKNPNFDPQLDFFSTFDDFRSSPEPPSAMRFPDSTFQAPAPPAPVVPPPVEVASPKKPVRHLQYATHFPIPQEELYTHESNQRITILYGVGKARDSARHILKKITKEIMKLYSKKNSIDVATGSDVKSKKKKEKEDSAPNFEALFHKFQKLSYHDMHLVTSSCAQSIQETIIAFATGQALYLPVMENVSFLFDLMEFALNVAGLLNFLIHVLKHLSDVEAQLHARGSALAGVYTTSLCLSIVAVLRKYHAYLLVSQDVTAEAFEGLCRVVKHVGNPSDCTSAERCILAYLCDLYTSCSYLKLKYCEFFGGACAKVKQTLHASIQPCASNLLWDPNVLIQVIENAKSRPDTHVIRQLNDYPANRYSFVCNALIKICDLQAGNDKLNEVSVLCAELTACCNMLCSEWLGVLKALCCSSNNACGFIDVLTHVDVCDLSIHDPIAVFTAILIARHCFSLQDLVLHVALPSLLAACPSAGGGTDAEPGARLTCHLLLRLFKTENNSSSSAHPSGKGSGHVKSSGDRHLLTATHDSIGIGPVLAVLKAILILGDSCASGGKAAGVSGPGAGDRTSGDIISTLLSSLDDDELMLGQPPAKYGMEGAGLSDFAKYSLKAICAQPWVREKFLKEPETLLSTDLLLDTKLSPKQAHELVRLVCFPDGVPGPAAFDEDSPENKDIVARILNTLDQWTLRVSWLELQLMLQQTPSSDHGDLLDDIAKCTIEVFQQQTEYKNLLCSNECPSPTLKSFRHDPGSDKSVWLLAPLVSKMPSSVQGKVLREAAQVLESGNNFWSSKSKTEKERNLLKSTSLLGHQPFLALVLNCLKGQDEQREGLLNSLLDQMEKFIQNAKEDKYPDDAKLRQIMQEALHLRLSLVGGMFDTIQRSNTNTTDWAVLLCQLVSYGVIDTQSNCDLFYTVLDMLSCLVHGTLVSDSSSERGDENKKIYLNLVKKLKKELGDKHTEGVNIARQLIPFPKRQYDVISYDVFGTRTDWKGNKTQKSTSKQGHSISMKNKVSAWDLFEGHRNSSALPLAWFGAIRVDRRNHTYDEQFRMSLYHSHDQDRPASYYLAPPPLPPEDLDPPPEKVPKLKEDMLISDPRNGADISKVKKPPPKRRPRGGRAMPTPTTNMHPSYMQTPMNMGGYPREPPMYPQGAAAGPAGGSGQWYGPGMPPQSPYYQQQMPPGGPAYSGSMSKAALGDFIRSGRRPGGWPANPQSIQIRQQLIRHQLMQQGRLGADNPAMYGQGMNPAPQQMPQIQGVSPQYPAAYQQGIDPPPHSNQQGMMASQGYQSGYGPPSQPGMLPSQSGYMGQAGPPPPAQFQPQRYQNPNMPMQPPQAPSMMSTYQQGAPQQAPPGYSSGMGGPQHQQQLLLHQQQQQQQRLLAAQQQKQQLQTKQQQQTAALVAQLQRTLGSGQAPQSQGPPPPQYGSFQPPPQY